MSNTNALSQTQEIDPPEDYPAKFSNYIPSNQVFQKLISLQAKLENIITRLDGIQKKTQEIHTEVCAEEMEETDDEETDEEIPSFKKRKY